jgi:hypothetical protein
MTYKILIIYINNIIYIRCAFVGLDNKHDKNVIAGSNPRLNDPSKYDGDKILRLFQAHAQNYEKRLLAPSCLPNCPPARMEQIGYHCTDFHATFEYLFENLSRKFKFH